MGRKTRLLKKLNKFGLKYANHPILRNKKEQTALILNMEEELQQPIKEEILEPVIEPAIIEEIIEVKIPTPPKKIVKPKK